MTIGNKIAAAFLKAQSEMGKATKDSKNPFFKSKYADLNSIREACMPSLNNNGISVLQPTVQVDGKNFVKTILLHESGETIESLTEILFNKPNDPQAQGSGISYARRYGLQSLVNVGAEDDDGNGAAEKGKENKPDSKEEPKKNAFGLSKDLIPEINKALSEDYDENKFRKAKEFFAGFKVLVEACKTAEEIDTLLETNKIKVAALRKYQELNDLLDNCVNECKDLFKVESI